MSENIYQSPNAELDDGTGASGSITLKELLFSFKGRIGRKLYWLSVLGLFVGMFVFILLLGLIGVSESIVGILTLIVYIPIIWISFAVQIKRWHDRDKSGWWVLITLVPVIGSLWALIENGFLAGDEGPNRFGVPRL
ncbi:Inner membrane protein YhaH [Thalassocella blandensis]|nr:Inner membrane protein YhaH [Thalassocella blandensis]